MKNDPTNERRNGLFFSLAALGLIATLVCTLPLFSMTQASVSDSDQAPDQITRSHQPGFENYDVRRDKKAKEKLEGFRAASGKNSLSISNEIQKMRTGEASLRNRIPTLQVEYNSNLNNAEVIAPDVKQGKSFLTDVAGASKDAETLRLFVKENCELVGFNASQADDLIVTADYTNPNGILSFASLEQKINGIPVFLGEVKAGFDRKGRMFRVINNLAPGLDYQSLSSEFGDPAEAVRNAFKHVPREIKPEDQALSAADSTDLKVKFGTGDWATVSEKMYFPTEPGVARAAWRILEWEPVAAYLVIVDAETGTMLWRKNITNDQTQSATYNVYANSTSMIKALDGPAPLTPGPISPNLGTQGTQVARTNVTLIGNEAPNTFNNLGWITDGANGGNGLTDGNNVQAGLDIASPDGIDSSVAGTNRVFSFNYNPPPGLGGATPDGATSATSRSGAVTQLFYLNNRYHDELYKLGFTEAAKNFQNDNFGRGGAAGDRVSAEAQDFSGTNNANFAVPPDGFRGKMQMYRFTQTPSRDGDLDADVVLHEHTHGLSNRLHGNGSGLSNGVAGSMGEGWSDFYALSLLSEPTDPVNGIYSTGSYVTFNIFGIGSTNSYYGIRRFPYAPIGFTGGPSNRPHNPLTFKDIDPAQASISDGAYQASPGFAGNPANEVHNAGEVWCSALVEVRAKLINSAGGNVAVGNLKALQFVTDGMKLAPPTPTFLQERDAIVAGALNSGTAQDVADIWAGFAARGMGFSARQNSGSFTVVEAFDLANLVQTPTFAVSDPAGNNNGYPDPGETIALTVPLTNSTGRNATGVTLQIVGSGNFTFYGNIANGQTVSNSLISYTIPANTPCGSSITLTFDVNSNLGPTSFTRSITVGAPIVTATENFDGVTAPALPSGWTTTQTGAGVGFVTVTNSADTAPNSVFTPDLTTTGGGAEITSPAFPISAAAGTVSFHHKYDTEAGWDGGVLEISIGGGAFQDIIAAGGTFVTGGYNGVLGAGVGNPLANRDAWSGDSGGYVTSTAQLPATANGQTVRFRWRFGADNNTVGNGANPGWNVDSITITGNYTCSSGLPVAKSRADFDGDG
ncbi:MAG: M36 family metallopeptidase, partial [Pyrinomonadaceae bacterium]